MDHAGVVSRPHFTADLFGGRSGANHGSAARNGSTGANPDRRAFVVAVDATITADWYPPEGRTGTSTYTLVVEGGQLKVLEHRWSGDPL